MNKNNINLTLTDSGFRYDEEDNLWYDENRDRIKYRYRIGISEYSNYIFFDLYCGGYDNKIGRFTDMVELLKNVK